MSETLSNREREVLKYVVLNFVKNALPVGSRVISKQSDLNLSSATIRNVMSDLEDMNLLQTPHTSAGRIPTDRGYRYFVDSLMDKEKLNTSEKNYIKNQLEENKKIFSESEELFSETSKILAKISHQLTIVSQPFLSRGIFEKLELVLLSSSRILVVINIKSGIVRTLIMEIDSKVNKTQIQKLTSYLNEKLSGLTLKEIRDTFSERIQDCGERNYELMQLFINSIDKLYTEELKGTGIYIGGTGEIILQPEFDDPINFKSIIDVSEDKNLVIHILQSAAEESNDISIKIGSENEDDKLKNYSIILSKYKYGDITGNIGIIGPKRINYGKIVSLIEYTSKLISEIKP